MKIIDYDFHKKLKRLISWCKPGTKYSLNQRGANLFNEHLVAHGRVPHNLIDIQNYLWLYVHNNNFVSRYNYIDINGITNIDQLSRAIGFLYLNEHSRVFSELILDTNNIDIAPWSTNQKP